MHKSFKKPGNSNFKNKEHSRETKTFGNKFKPTERKKVITPLKDGKFEVNVGKFHHVFDDEAGLHEWKRSQSMSKKQKNKSEQWCFSCRKAGHLMSNCSLLDSKAKSDNALICFHCGDSNHNIYNCQAPEKNFAFAKCFICSQTGHLSRHCPKGKQSIYPNGGGCHLCDKTDHLIKDCPLKCPNKFVKKEKLKTCKDSNMKIVGGDDDDFE